jgi:methyl-accepting chemotaxis protein
MKQTLDIHRVGFVSGIFAIFSFGWLALSIINTEVDGIQIWLALATSIVLGGIAIFIFLSNPKEIVVIRERAQQEYEAAQQTEQEQQTIDLQAVSAAIKQNKKDDLSAGLKAICKQLDAAQGAAYRLLKEDESSVVKLTTGYALSLGENQVIQYSLGEGLIGQAAAENKSLYVDEVPEGYMKVVSGLGMASPRYLFITPIKKQNQVEGVLEISTFKPIKESERKFIEEAATLIGQTL